MSEVKHTPGPWQMSGARTRSPEYKGHAVGPDGTTSVVVVPYEDRSHNECLANARLIAAAPELLEVAQLCIGSLPSDTDDLTREVFRRIRAAIAKALG